MPFTSIAEIVDFVQSFGRDFARELLVGVTITFLAFLYAHMKGARERGRFRRIFGKAVVNASDIVLSVPLWCAIKEDRTKARFRKSGPGHADRLLYGPDQMYNRQDMLAAAHVLSVLNNHFEKEVRYTNDTESPNWDQKTLILVGSPISNFHAQDYLDEYKKMRPNDAFPEFREFGHQDPTGLSIEIVDSKSGKIYRSGDEFDYGMVLRLPNVFSGRSDYFVFLVAGIHEWSTREAGRLFIAHWRSLGQQGTLHRLIRLLQPWKWHETLPPAGFLFQMKIGDDNNRETGIGTGKIIQQI